jgi:hypothetical protein
MTMSEVNKPAGKRTRFNLIHDVSWAMCKALPNVRTYDESPSQRHDAVMMEIVFNAALEHRNWTFKMSSMNTVGIYNGEEELGSVERQYSRRVGENMPHLSADRIPSTRGRSGTFSHKEAAPILRKMREYVYPLTDNEIMDAAISSVPGAIGTKKYHADRAKIHAQEEMSTAAVAFALDPMFKEQFLQYEATFGVALKRDTAKAMREQEEAEEQSALLAIMHKEVGKEYAVVVQTTRGWYAKYKNEITKFAADELPEMFGAMNALKLVNDGIAVPDLGMKINSKTFVVVVTTGQAPESYN